MAIATVISITGEAYVRDENGNLRELSVGDTLEEGEVLVTSENGRVQLDFGDGIDPTVIEGGQQVAMTPDLIQLQRLADQAEDDEDLAEDESSALDEDLEALLTAIEEGDDDLLASLDATAAGAGGGGGEGGGHDFVRLVRITENTDPLAFEFSSASLDSVEFDEAEPELLLAEEDETVNGTVTFEFFSGEVNVGGESVVEGNNFTLVATVDTAPVGSPLVITLSNGQQITIPVGGTSGQVVLDSREDDLYVQGDETIVLSVTGTTGGGFDELTVGDVPSLTVVDDNDVTGIELFIPDAEFNLPAQGDNQYSFGVLQQPFIEGGWSDQPYPGGTLEGTQVTVGARVENAPQDTDLIIRLSNGEEITIAVGDTEGTTTFELPNVPEGGDTLELTIESVSGGNYEAVDFADALAQFDIIDSRPFGGETVALVDDEGLAGGNEAGIDDDEGQGDNEATYSGNLGFSYGGDGPGTVDFSAMDQQTASLGQENITYSWDADTSTLTASVNTGDREGTNLFTVTIDDADTGDYTVELLNNILHSEGDDENNAFANLTYTVTDADGSEEPGYLGINFDDDTPKAEDVDAGTLTEDGDTTVVSGNVFDDEDAAYGADGAG
ncbi:retention module-containing protein, partial [Halomonas daqiaonensis]